MRRREAAASAGDFSSVYGAAAERMLDASGRQAATIRHIMLMMPPQFMPPATSVRCALAGMIERLPSLAAMPRFCATLRYEKRRAATGHQPGV